MKTTSPRLALIDGSASIDRLDLASELFHRINRVIPEDQALFHLAPTCTAKHALSIMEQNGYSQVPVLSDDGLVLGVFSYRSFSKTASRLTLEELKEGSWTPGELSIDECMETWDYASVTEEWSRAFDRLDKDGGLLIGSRDNLVAILSPMDLLRYLNKLASPFVWIRGIRFETTTVRL